MTFGKRLSELRTKKSLSQYQLAKLTNISRSRISLYELDKREPDIATIKQLADFFNISIDYLLGNEPTTPPTPQAISPEDAEILKKLKETSSDRHRAVELILGINDNNQNNTFTASG